MDNTKKNVISLSGGKDSTAMLLLAIERGVEFDAVFADTGNEHQMTYDYVRYLADKLKINIQWVRANFSVEIERKRNNVLTTWFDYFVNGFDGEWNWKKDTDVDEALKPVSEPARPSEIYQSAAIETDGGKWVWTPARKPIEPEIADQIVQRASDLLVPTGNPFLDLCLWKGRFPSTKARFCSQELKRVPIQFQVIMPLLDLHDEVWSWQGVRADESESRSKLTEIEDLGGSGLINYRPILSWTAQDCFDMHKKHGIDPNPLYKMGMGRVGCMPCIHARKAELSEIAKRFPDEITRIAEWERLVSIVSRRQSATFFTSDEQRGHGVYDHVAWSKTSRGGKQFDLITAIDEGNFSCSSIYGLCE
jgi:3'-phosphoadenosine 5'-phosphosulfate sulfotransferase (PAPS reductase)/FAD synthetase